MTAASAPAMARIERTILVNFYVGKVISHCPIGCQHTLVALTCIVKYGSSRLRCGMCGYERCWSWYLISILDSIGELDTREVMVIVMIVVLAMRSVLHLLGILWDTYTYCLLTILHLVPASR